MTTETISPSTYEGFYMYETSERTGRVMLFHAKKQILFPDGNTLLRANSGSYTYPVSGWTWFDSLNDCCTSFGLNIEDHELDIYGPYYEAVKGYPYIPETSE